MGDEGERASGYYSRPWQWEQIKKNVGSHGVAVFHSDNDPFIPLEEAEHVATSLDAEYFMLPNRSHFFRPPLHEVVRHLTRRQGGPAAKPSNALRYRGGDTSGAITVLGLGSLLSERSARTTFPNLTKFRFVRVPHWRRVFAHAAAIFFERGIANKGAKEFASLSAEPVFEATDQDGATGFMASCFEVHASDTAAWAAFERREEEFDLVWAGYEELTGETGSAGVLCAFGADELVASKWGQEGLARMVKPLTPEFNSLFQYDSNSGLLPCPVYLRHVVLAATKSGDQILNSFLDETFLVDKKTTVRAFLESRPDIMEQEPPESLKVRYGG